MLPRPARICDSRGRRMLVRFSFVLLFPGQNDLRNHSKSARIRDRSYSCVFVDRLLVEVQNQPAPAAGSALETLDTVRIRSTYFAMTSTSRFTSSPGFKCEKFVTSHVFGITAISK